MPQGATREQALAAIRLVGLVNDVSLRGLIPDELAKGFGFVQSKPASALSPVFVTPDALGDRWRDGKLHGVLSVDLNGQPFGRAETGTDMTFDFGTLIAHLAKTRAIGAGSIIGSGTVSNRDADGGPGQPVAKGGRGYSCIAEMRMVETIEARCARPRPSSRRAMSCASKCSTIATIRSSAPSNRPSSPDASVDGSRRPLRACPGGGAERLHRAAGA